MGTTNNENIKNHFERISSDYDYWKKKNSYYYSLIKRFYQGNIPPGSSVVEFGCATADVLSSVKPNKGLGIDISSSLIELAKKKYPRLEFKIADAAEFSCQEKFDYCIMSDLIDHLSDIPASIENARDALKADGRLLITTINPLWNPVFGVLERLHLKMPEGPHCFIPNRYIEFFCKAKGFEIISKGALVFLPLEIPLISGLLNNVMPKVPLLNRLCWVQTLIARKAQAPKKELSYSLIIPVYNEQENIRECIERVPKTGKDFEIIVIDDGSEDTTQETLAELLKEGRPLKVIRFPRNKGKASAVQEGIRSAGKDIVIILDADMAVAPEDIPLFLEPLERGLVDFVNGTRLVYDMEKKAMDQIKRIANFFLATLVSVIIKFRITDTLCGTKAFFSKDFRDLNISAERWGDLALLYAAKEKGLRVGEVPIKYHSRKSGESKMRFFSDGMKFILYTLKMALK